MGNEFSQSPDILQEQLQRQYAARERQRERDEALFRALDAHTKVPHLLVELRSLGYVEICGKNLGGIYERLGQWLRAHWGCELVTHDAREAISHQRCTFYPEFADFCCSIPFSDYLMCGCHPCCCCCCNGSTLVLQEQQPLMECDRLCDANFAMPKKPTPWICRMLGILECDRHYPLCCWYGSRFVFASCIPKPSVFRVRGFSGENNMGKLTMQLVDFMTNECGWSLTLCNGTNLGFYGEIREQQIKFAAPHPLNLIAPHIMIEMRERGFIELNGPNTEGVYETLQHWFESNWKAQRIRNDPDFCDAKFRCSVFKKRGREGENNMGLCTMQLVDFMTLKCAWTLIACNGGNFGKRGDLREQQLVFRNDTHVQHGEDHVMVELRDVQSLVSNGYIEVNGVQSSPSITEPLDAFFKNEWGCVDYQPLFGRNVEPFCEKKYRTPEGFYYRSQDLTNNLGLRTIELATFMASQGWLLLLCNGGAITEMKSHANRMRARSMTFRVGREFSGQINREQQIKFTKARAGESADAPLLMIELRAIPQDPELENVPFCIGPRCIYGAGWCEFGREHDWKSLAWGQQTADRRKTRREEVRHWLNADTFSEQRNTSKGSMDPKSCSYLRSYASPRWRTQNSMRLSGKRLSGMSGAELSSDDVPGCAIFNGVIEVNGPNTNGIYEKLEQFIKKQMRGYRLPGGHGFCNALFGCRVLRMKRVPFPVTHPEIDGYYLGENNFGIYTMRLCDFLVDHLGEWDLIVCNGNALERAWKVDRDRAVSITTREQQLVFRHRQGRRNVFMGAKFDAAVLGRTPLQAPAYWKPRSLEGLSPKELITVDGEELSWMQELLDGTFKNIATKDRKGKIPSRFLVVTAVRSEHPALWDRYARRRQLVQDRRRDAAQFVVPRTMTVASELAKRCSWDSGNPINEAYLLHGTSPTSALAILETSFKVEFAGGASGTMFGPGVYLAESSSKSDEYAQDDAEGAYKGLFAMLVCRAVVGKPFATEKPGDYRQKALSGDCDCILGDREKAVGTFREFIFFHEGSIYPEYIIFYRRDYTKSASDMPTAAVYGRPAAAPPGTVAVAPAQLSMANL